MKNLDKSPKVFISYSWTSPEHKEWVLDLAARLRTESGIDVILDRYELKIGNETHSFMEKSIERADKILVVCDSMYRKKANERKGGAGIETMLLTNQVYQDDKQTKVIPVVVELDEKGKYCLPRYLENRLSYDFSDVQKFEETYEELIRFIWDEPKMKVPKLGKKPDFDKSMNLKEKRKILYLYSDLIENGHSHIKCRLLIEKLTVNFEVDMVYGILPDEQVLKLQDASLQKQVVKESDVNYKDYQIIIIEKTIGNVKQDKKGSSKFNFSFLNSFIQNGGLCIFLNGDNISRYGTTEYNKILSSAGLPLIQEAKTEDQFPLMHLVDHKKLSEYVIIGWDTRSQSREYKISFDSSYDNALSGTLSSVFKNVRQLKVINTLQMDICLGIPLFFADSRVKMLTSKDLFWDGVRSHSFISYIENGTGVGVHIGTNLCADRLVEKQDSDAIVFMENVLAFFLKIIDSKKKMMV